MTDFPVSVFFHLPVSKSRGQIDIIVLGHVPLFDGGFQSGQNASYKGNRLIMFKQYDVVFRRF
jgi:hypothetical protein